MKKLPRHLADESLLLPSNRTQRVALVDGLSSVLLGIKIDEEPLLVLLGTTYNLCSNKLAGSKYIDPQTY